MDLSEINAALRKLRDGARKRQKRDATGVLTPWSLQVAACIAVLLDFDFTAATDWLDSSDRRGKRSRLPLDLETIQAKVEDFVIATPDEQLCQWTNPVDSPLPLTVLRTAVAWSEHRRLRDWVRKVNVDHGTPVRSEAVARQFNASLSQHELAEYCDPIRENPADIKKWCWRWRGKQGGKIAFLRTTEHISLDDKRQQAYGGIHFLPPFGGHIQLLPP